MLISLLLFKTGKTWFQVPESVKVFVRGEPSSGLSAKDLTLYIVKQLGTKKQP